MKPIRVGEISFTNILPIYHYFDSRGIEVEWIPQVPSQLNRGMAKGEIDMGPISSFAYAEQYPNYVLMPDLSVSSHGPVGSIFLFTREAELKDLRKAKIALPSTSATSVALLRILMELFEEGQPEYVTMQPSLDKMMVEADAALLIGDDALLATWSNPGYRALDLGQEWYNRTGLSMVFAVWAVRREIAANRPQELKEVYDRFMESKARGQIEMGPVISKAQQRLGGSTAIWEEYYQKLIYDFGPNQQEGLNTFYHYAAKLGLLPTDAKVHLLSMQGMDQQKTRRR